MAVGPSDISGNDWCGPVNSSPAADRMSDLNFGANPVFLGPKFELGTHKKPSCASFGTRNNFEEVKQE